MCLTFSLKVFTVQTEDQLSCGVVVPRSVMDYYKGPRNRPCLFVSTDSYFSKTG